MYEKYITMIKTAIEGFTVEAKRLNALAKGLESSAWKENRESTDAEKIALNSIDDGLFKICEIVTTLESAIGLIEELENK